MDAGRGLVDGQDANEGKRKDADGFGDQGREEARHERLLGTGGMGESWTRGAGGWMGRMPMKESAKTPMASAIRAGRRRGMKDSLGLVEWANHGRGARAG